MRERQVRNSLTGDCPSTCCTSFQDLHWFLIHYLQKRLRGGFRNGEQVNRARLIDLLFPDGLYYENGGFRTRENADGFSVFDLLETPQNKMATLRVLSWNRFIGWLAGIGDSARRSA